MYPEKQRLVEIVSKLASFHTRNTLSSGHREAADWIEAQYQALGLRTEQMEYILPVGKRVAEPTGATQVLAFLPGKTDRRIIVSAHFDTLNLSEDQATGRAPGANDDASGIAVGLETARVMADTIWENTVVFAAFSGEEQGLCGARALAKRAKEEGWEIDAVLNYDMVGNAGNLRGKREDSQVRCFSDDQSRELARWLEWLVRDEDFGFGLKLVLRHDRFGRGGDHTPFNQEGFRAVRFTEVYEDYSLQHTANDLPESVDFDLLAGVARANMVCTRALATATSQPTEVKKSRENGHDTKIVWSGPDSATVLWRETTSARWEHCHEAKGGEAVLQDVTIDDNEFAVTTGGIPVVASA
jgi:Zn-dependent M28 family amino/carboxypeptidase